MHELIPNPIHGVRFEKVFNTLMKFSEKVLHCSRTLDEEIDDASKDAVEQTPIYRKQCHLCHTFLNPEDNLVDHMEANHREYFDGMMEATAEMSL